MDAFLTGLGAGYGIAIQGGAIAILIVGLRRVGQVTEEPDQVTDLTDRGLATAYARLLGLTIINPTTIVYFAAVIIVLWDSDPELIRSGPSSPSPIAPSRA